MGGVVGGGGREGLCGRVVVVGNARWEDDACARVCVGVGGRAGGGDGGVARMWKVR